MQKHTKTFQHFKIMQKHTKVSICLLVVGSLLLLIGTIVILVFPSLFQKAVKKDMVLTEHSKSYDYWQTIKLPVYQKFYFFNVTNPTEIQKGAIPILTEVGPYVYREHLIKENITWNSNGTVTYQERHVYYYQQNMTSLKEDDVIVTINTPLLTLANTLLNESLLIKFFVDVALVSIMKNEKLFVKHTVKELTFGGYLDLLVALSTIVEKNPPVKGNKFGWFYPQNNTNDGIYNVLTGKNDFSKFLWVDKWQNKSSLNYWAGEYCNHIKGPVPELFKPLNNEDKLYMFVTDLCRSVYLDYQEDVTVHGAINSRRYVMSKSILENSEKNKCFCKLPSTCYPTGVMDASNCHGGAPVAISWPHFYMGDPKLLKDVVGLKPDKAKHEFYWDIEPITGMTSQFSARIQINVPLKKYPHIVGLTNVKDLLLPVLWLSKDGVMTDFLKTDLLAVTQKPRRIVNGVCYSLIGVGILIVVCTLIVFIIITVKAKKRQEPLLVDDEPVYD